ncbi:MAG TPA: hypothetical protein VM865_04295 [Acidobacteriaceae bacterium]|jgi:hypothetical protein|nr:hypothetical protein [Acidobacteriaceae bacterium]
MKISTIIFLVLMLGAVGWTVFRYFWERRRQQRVDREGLVVYAALVSCEPVKFLGRPQGDLEKVVLRVQEPGQTETREVTIRTRIDSRQRMEPGMRIPVVIDPKDPKRVYPASAESAKRAVATGSRLERRVMQQQMRRPGRGVGQQPSGYQPPQSTMRRR